MKHFILFTGHMIDAPDRATPRFPAYKEQSVQKEIKLQLLHQQLITKLPLQGIASGACGGDMLFHETCLELNIPSEIYLPSSSEEFKKGSVSFAGKEWDERFDTLLKKLPYHVLSQAKEEITMNVYERTNEWMLQKALVNGGKNMTLIALWDGGGGDGKGGTKDMINMAKEKGADVEVIDIKKL